MLRLTAPADPSSALDMSWDLLFFVSCLMGVLAGILHRPRSKVVSSPPSRELCRHAGYP